MASNTAEIILTKDYQDISLGNVDIYISLDRHGDVEVFYGPSTTPDPMARGVALNTGDKADGMAFTAIPATDRVWARSANHNTRIVVMQKVS